MNLHDLIASPLVYRLGWTLLHSLWQGAAVAGMVAMALWMLPRASSNTRYLVALAGLLLSLALPAATFQLVSVATPHLAPLTIADQLRSQSALSRASTDREGIPLAPRGSAAMIPSTTDEPSRSPAVLAPSGITQPSSIAQIAALAAKLEPAFPCLVGTWILGVLSLSLWHLGGWIAAQRLKSLGTHPADAAAHKLLARLMRRMNLRRPVRLMQSVLVETPLVLGWLRPVILVPASVLSGLSPAQLEAILAHELAHIRRHDYLVNLLQIVIETLLFYHPAIWWLSRQVRREREHCCDDLAVQVCGDRLTYATALAAIEEVRQPDATLAMAAGGGVLLSRIRRLLATSSRPPLRQSRSLVAACLAMSLVLMPLILNRTSLHAAAQGNTTQPSKPLTLQLGTAASVTLLGLTRASHGPDQAWWAPDGTPLHLPELEKQTIQESGTIIAFRLDPPDMAVTPYFLLQGSFMHPLKKSWTTDQGRILLGVLDCPEDQRYGNLQVETKSGPWKDLFEVAATKDDFLQTRQIGENSIRTISAIKALDANQFRLTIFHDPQIQGERLAARDSSGRIHPPADARTTDYQATELRFDFPLEQLTALVRQARTSTDAEFLNIALKPGTPAQAGRMGRAASPESRPRLALCHAPQLPDV